MLIEAVFGSPLFFTFTPCTTVYSTYIKYIEFRKEKIMSRYLTENQIDILAKEAVTNYELSCDWGNAGWAAHEYSVDEFGIRPRATAIQLIVKRAILKWQGETLRVKSAIA
jgi:hypothetical protein